MSAKVPPKPEAPAERGAEGAADQQTHAACPPSVTVSVTIDKDDARYWPVVRAVLYPEPDTSPAGDAPLGSPEARELRPGAPISFHASPVGGEASGPRRAGASPTKRKRRKGREARRRHNARRRRLITLGRKLRAIQSEMLRLRRRGAD